MGYRLEQEFNWSEASERRNRLTSVYEPLQPYVLKGFLEEFGADIFLDIGANIGYYSIVLSGSEKLKNIYCFEPLDPAFNEIQKNIALNSLEQRIVPYQVGISSRSGTAKMGILGELSGANAILSTSFQEGLDVVQQTNIETRPLDEIVQVRGHRIGMKIDVEGHEEEVVKGSEELLRENNCLLQIELYDHAERSKGARDRLERLGYQKIFKIGPDVYMTNDTRFLPKTLPAIEEALALYIEHSKAPPRAHVSPPIRRRIVKGVHVEFTPKLSKYLRRLFLH